MEQNYLYECIPVNDGITRFFIIPSKEANWSENVAFNQLVRYLGDSYRNYTINYRSSVTVSND